MNARGPAHRLAGAALAASALAVGAAGCDPCSGVVRCRVAPRLSYGGKIVDLQSGRGVAGVSVVFRRTGGAPLPGDSLVARTDAEGRYRLEVGAAGADAVVGALTVRPPAPLAPYTVPDVRLVPTTVAGGGGVLPTYVTQPYVDFVGELLYRRSGGPLSWSGVSFRRTGGARFAGSDVVATAAGPDGWFFLQAAVTPGETFVRGELLVQTADFPRPFLVREVTVPVRFTDRIAALDRSFRLGAAVDYVAELQYRPTREPVANADVEFRQTGGLGLTSPRFVGRTDASGRVALALVPAAEASGEVVGDLTVRAPGLRTPYVVTGLRLRTYDSDELPFLGVLGVGYQAVAVGELTFRGDRQPLAGADVEFVRTGGVTTRPARTVVRSRSDGRFGVELAADSAGEIVGELRITPSGGGAPVRVPGVRLQARGDDSVRAAGRWGVGAQLLYVGQLAQRATGAPAVGWTVTFRRAGGIALARDSSAAQSVDWGGFAIAPDTRAEGEVEGTLHARAPGGGREVSLGVVRLRTHADDSVRFAGRWTVGPSLLYVGELLRADTDRPIVGARVEFRRTGGIATAESLLVERTNADGRFRLAPTPSTDGEVVGDLHVFPPAPLRDTVIVGVRLATFESDEVRLREVWRVAPPAAADTRASARPDREGAAAASARP